MGDIKSAREIAMEKIGKLGEVTDEERLKWDMSQKGKGWRPDTLSKIAV